MMHRSGLQIGHFQPTLTQVIDAPGDGQKMETWDVWKAQALEAGVSEELAALGREILRDYQQHGLAAEDPRGLELGADGDHLRELALRAPNTAFVDFNACLIWGGASGLDGDIEAFSMLIERLGSQDAADAALQAEEGAVRALEQRQAQRQA
jgi:hypothetical protein